MLENSSTGNDHSCEILVARLQNFGTTGSYTVHTLVWTRNRNSLMQTLTGKKTASSLFMPLIAQHNGVKLSVNRRESKAHTTKQQNRSSTLNTKQTETQHISLRLFYRQEPRIPGITKLPKPASSKCIFALPGFKDTHDKNLRIHELGKYHDDLENQSKLKLPVPESCSF